MRVRASVRARHDPTEMTRESTPGARRSIGAVRGALLAALAVTIVHAVVLSVTRPPTVDRLVVRALHHAYDTGQQWALALVAGVLASAGGRLSSRWFGGSVAVLVALSALLSVALSSDLSIFVERFASPALADAVEGGIVIATAAATVGGWYLAVWVARGRFASVPFVLGLGGLVGHSFALTGDYPGVHLALVIGSGSVLAGAAAGLPAPAWLPATLPRLAWAAVVGLAGWSVTVRPSNAVLVEMLRNEGSVVAPIVSRLHAARGASGARFYDDPRWLVSRRDAADVPPTDVARAIRDPIVLLITIDALRFDLLDHPRHRAALPVLSELAKHSVRFTEARSPGAQTVYTLGAVFSGVYFSQQYWSKGAPNPSAAVRNGLFPHEDDTPRFPELLQRAGVRTVTPASAVWLVNEVGIVRGFDEQRFIDPKRSGEKYTFAPALTDAAIRRLKRTPRGESLFLFMHYLDPHAPYNRGRGEGSPFDRYLAELSYVDKQLGRLLATLTRAKLDDRTVLIVSSDHGESFGEHDAHYHATTLYDDVLRVPLLVRMPGVEPRSVETPVSLIDLGPTILDVFGLPTPGRFMGESLLGLIHGRPSTPSRPIVAEGRLKKSWVFADGRKLIVDDTTGLVEIYDLKRDPRELHNLAEEDASTDARVASLRAFFEAHRIRRRGYVTPLRR